MLEKIGNFIVKKPWLTIILVLIITIGLSTRLPQIEMKTQTEDFMPKEEVVTASNRITNYFGQDKQTMFLYINSEESEHILTPDAIREQYYIQQNLVEKEEVDSAISGVTFINQISQIEYGKSVDECTDEQINTILDDLFSEPEKEIKILQNDDSNEKTNYRVFPNLLRGKKLDSLDIKNGDIGYNNKTMSFTINVYDLSEIEKSLKNPLIFTNTLEWYIDFENTLTLTEEMDIDYRIAAHIEPKHPLWTIGEGILPNIKNLFQNVKNRELFNTYEKKVYLWVKPPNSGMYFPLPLETGEMDLNKNKNQINIEVNREELGRYGIATQLGSFSLPAKLSNLSIGCRYFKNPLGTGWLRVETNRSYILNKIQKWQQKPILSGIADRILKRVGDISVEDFDDFFKNADQNMPLPDKIALKDIESQWKNADTTEKEKKILFIKPTFYDDIKVGTEGFISKEYRESYRPSSSLIILELNLSATQGYSETINVNRLIVDSLNQLDKERSFVSAKATGQGVVSSDINKVTSEANQFIAPSIFIIVFVILFLNFRRLSYVILPMLTLLIATIWLFGTLVILGMSFSVMHVALIPLVLGLGVDYAVHLFHNYRSEIDDGKNPSEAILNSVKDVGGAMFLAMVTTVIAFLSFLSATVPGVKNFGILLALGVAFTFITAITILPAMRYLLDRKNHVKTSKLKIFDVNVVMGKVSQAVIKHRKKILLIMVVISLLFATGAYQLQTSFDLDQYVPSDTPSIELFEKIGANFPSSSQQQDYILIEGDVASVETLKGIKETHDNLKDDTFVARNPDGSLKTQSVYTVIQEAISLNNSLIKEYNINPETGIPRSDEDVKELYDYLYSKKTADLQNIDIEKMDMREIQDKKFEMDTTGGQIRNVLHKEDSSYDATVIRVYISSAIGANGESADKQMEVIKRELQNDVTEYGECTSIVTGSNIITLTITSSLNESQTLSTLISILLAAIVLILAYRNPLLGLIAMIPVTVTMLWILGSMYFIGYTLNSLTITITSITIGIGIDYSIHATERFRLVADRTGDVTDAMKETISHTGGALLIAALTTACGFGILAFAPIPPQQQFGVILAITITYSLLTSILILPVALVKWAKWRKKRKGYIVSTNGMKKVDGKWTKVDENNKQK
ncbi:MAG: efflux RND transporter permease subunit [Candidatus Thermoplasmatota archaeon]